jgi:hypothetical protein
MIGPVAVVMCGNNDLSSFTTQSKNSNNMKRLLPILCVPFLLGQVNGQTFNKAYDLGADDYGNNIMLQNGGLMIVGSSTSNTGGTFCAAVTTADLDGVMSSGGGQVGGPGTEFGRDFYTAGNGEMTVLGRSNSFTAVPQDNNDHMVLRFGDGGAPAWMTVFGSDSVDLAIDMTEANDGGVIVVGQSKRRHLQRIDGVAVKLSAADGSIEWAKEIGFEFINETVFNVKALGSGEGYVLVGYSGANIIGLNEAMVVILDDDGNMVLSFLFGGPSDDDARILLDAASGDDGFYVAGNTRNIGQGSGECFLAKFSFDNNDTPVMDWFKTYGSAGNESLQSALKDGDDNILLVGTTSGFGNGQEGFLVKVDSDGEVIWANVYGGSGDDFLQNVIEDGEGGYVAIGYSNSFGGNGNDQWVVRLDTDGNSGCQQAEAAFVKTDIDPSVAYIITSHEQIDNITSTDVTLTVRDASALGSFNNEPSENDLCNPVSVDENVVGNVLSVFPNPSENGVFNVNVGVGRNHILVIDAMGRELFASQTSQSSMTTIDLSNAPKGMYLLTVTDMVTGNRETSRLVK